MARIGIFLCHCGTNIAGVVNISQVREAVKDIPQVVLVEESKYMCSEMGQGGIREAIEKNKLDRVIISACSPRMHENTFRKTVADAGLNPYLLEIANVREQDSWVHADDKEAATEKAIALTRTAVAKALLNQPLTPKRVGLTKRALVIGGGIAGIQAALDIANAGHPVVLVEREPTIGGRMAQLDKTFPTLDCSSCILTPRMVEANQHPNITIFTYSEVMSVSGFVGNFKVQIRQKARHVDSVKCTGCGICWQKCPDLVPSEFDTGLGGRKIIYVPFAQAIPNVPVIDMPNCRYVKHLEAAKEGKKLPPCRICEKLCPTGAIDWEQEDQVLTEDFGAIVVATGFKPFDYGRYTEFGAGKYPDVIGLLQLERLLSASGPTNGELKRPSDGAHPKTVVFLSCIGSRDERMGKPYCSKVCCMVMAKQAILLKDHDPEIQPYVFYIDVRAGGKDYEEFYQRSQREQGVLWLRGRVSKLYQDNGKVIVMGEDSLMGRPVEIAADLVVMATGMEANDGAVDLAQTLHISYDTHGFMVEAHPKLRPLETNTDGIFLAGTVSGPRDIPETVAQGSGVAAKVLGLFSKDELATDPTVAYVDAMRCTGCFLCAEVCPYGAIDKEPSRDGRLLAKVNESLCKGCGLCVAGCRGNCINLRGFTNQQVIEEIMALCR
ncbi:MAG: CoB--CoM heterodisulfide reductase iron-sulfur subunit A family protein [Dehalococcoidia bacterium]|nr:CoB--CoM heterodisulfide reductase iron-sulfur subunit A family protein [Dehalococcoidia bacterium]